MAESSSDSVARILALASECTTDVAITSQHNVGGVSEGQTFSSDTPVLDIIKAILGPGDNQVKVYFGHSETLPTSIAGLTEKTFGESTLLDPDGFLYTITCGIPGSVTPPVVEAKAEYAIIALPYNATYGNFTLEHWQVYNFPFDLEYYPNYPIIDTSNGFIIFCLSDASYDLPDGIKYRFKIKKTPHV